MHKNKEFLELKKRAKLGAVEIAQLLGMSTTDVRRIVRGENKASISSVKMLGFYVDYLEMGV